MGSGANDVGFEVLEDGTIRSHISEYDKRRGDWHETGLGRLKQAYNNRLLEKEARKRGFRVDRRTLPNGNIRLEFIR